MISCSEATRPINSSATMTTSDSSSFLIRATTYVTFGFAATAVFETSVHGVVVQTSSEALSAANGPDVMGNRTYTDGSVTVSYPCANS